MGLLDAILEFFYSSVEYNTFGFNVLTFVEFGALLILYFEVKALVVQIKDIWREQSVESLSTYMFSYSAGFFAACIPYGVAKGSLLIIFASVAALAVYLPIVWGIHLFRGFTRREQLAMVGFALMLPSMIWLPWMEIEYLIFSVGIVIAQWDQARELKRNEDVGVLELRVLVMYFISASFWACYAFYIDAPALMVLNPLMMIVLAITIMRWLKYNKLKQVASAH